MNSLLVFFLSVVSGFVQLVIIAEVDIVHLYHFCMTREVQVIAHAKIRYQFQIICFIGIEDILNQTPTIFFTMCRKVFSDYHKTPSVYSLQLENLSLLQ